MIINLRKANRKSFDDWCKRNQSNAVWLIINVDRIFFNRNYFDWKKRIQLKVIQHGRLNQTNLIKDRSIDNWLVSWKFNLKKIITNTIKYYYYSNNF